MNNWQIIPLSEAIFIQKGKKPFDLGSKSDIRNTPYINIAAFETGVIAEYAPTQNIPFCKSEDTLIVWDGARAGLSGRGVSGYIGSTLAKVTSDIANPDYLFYFIQSKYHFLNTQTKGVGIPHINPTILGNLEFPIPPLAEQTRIVAKLEELLSDLDTATSELKTAQKKLTQYRQSLLKAAVEGALTAEWRSQNTPNESGSQLLERILKERRARWEQKQLEKFKEQGKIPPKDWQKKYVEPVQPYTTGLMELPEGWVWTCIGQSFHVAVGATPSRKEPNYWNGDIPWVSSGEVRFTHIIDTKEKISLDGLKNSSTNINPIGSVLLGMIGEGKTRGQVSILDIEAANNQNCAAIWVSETDIPSDYVYYWLWSRYEETRKGSSGNNQPALNKSIVEKIPMPLPPLVELEQLTQLLNIALKGIANQEKFIEHSLKQAAAQRKNILKAAFSGQLVPQDPNDEPASVLLERIKAERAVQEKLPKIKKVKSPSMSKSTIEEQVRDWILNQPTDQFSFDDIKRDIASDYESLKDSIFTLLAENTPTIEQAFNAETGSIEFKRVSK